MRILIRMTVIWCVLLPTTRGRSRHFGLTSGELSLCPSLQAVHLFALCRLQENVSISYAKRQIGFSKLAKCVSWCIYHFKWPQMHILMAVEDENRNTKISQLAAGLSSQLTAGFWGTCMENSVWYGLLTEHTESLEGLCGSLPHSVRMMYQQEGEDDVSGVLGASSGQKTCR